MLWCHWFCCGVTTSRIEESVSTVTTKPWYTWSTTWSSSYKNCMKLIRILTLVCLDWNLRVFSQYIPTKSYYFVDALSRGQMARFWLLAIRDNITVNPIGAQLPIDISDFEINWIFCWFQDGKRKRIRDQLHHQVPRHLEFLQTKWNS